MNTQTYLYTVEASETVIYTEKEILADTEAEALEKYNETMDCNDIVDGYGFEPRIIKKVATLPTTEA